ncbi:Uncharacterised protein [uncultured Comamonas sp.]|nr:Uncharacterised protein [uncultured Comamonas sp.]
MTEAQARQNYAAAKARLEAVQKSALAQVEAAAREYGNAKRALQTFTNQAITDPVMTFTDTINAARYQQTDY